MTCITCTSSGCGDRPCQRLERELRKVTVTQHELTGNSTGRGGTVTLADLQYAAPTEFKFPFLKSRDNTLLNAFYVDGFSYRQIARTFRIKKNSVGPRLTRIRAKIARHR